MATIKSFTSIEQSKKLAEILPLESADVHYTLEDFVDEDTGDIFSIEKVSIGHPSKTEIGCWSLAALLDVIKEQGLVYLRFLQSTYDNRGNHLTNVWCCTFENLGIVSLDLYADNPVDACVSMVEQLHELKML